MGDPEGLCDSNSR